MSRQRGDLQSPHTDSAPRSTVLPIQYIGLTTQPLKRTQSAEETRQNTAVGRERHVGVEDELNLRSEPGKAGCDATTTREGDD
jgi:hypothetical protein